MKRQLIVLFLFVFTVNVSAQLLDNLSFGLESNAIWYNDDKKTGSFYDNVNDNDEHFRSNNYLKLDYSFLKNFKATVQFESYEPFALLNYSPNFNETNIATYSLNYKTDKLDVTAGYVYEQFGSGLVLRSWEDRQLGINNALRGGKATYTPTDFLSFTALYGKHRVGFKTSEGEIFGFNSDIDLTSLLKFENSTLGIGLSYVGRKEDLSIEEPAFDYLTNAFSNRLDYSYKNFYSSAEYVYKSEDAVVQVLNGNNVFPDDFVKPGSALLFNTGYSKKGLGIDLTLRRMENMGFYSDREKTGNIYNENIVNYTPALTKQHDYVLTNIFVYQSQPLVSFNYESNVFKVGEIGGQIDIFYKIEKDTPLGGKYGTKIAFNASYWAGLKADITQAGFEIDPDYETEFLGFGSKYFSDFNLEVRKKWSSKWSSIFYYVNQYYNTEQIEAKYNAETIKNNIGVIESTYKFGNNRSLRLEAQKLWSNSEGQDWLAGTLEFNLSSKYSIYVNDSYNSGTDHDTSKIHYYNFGGSFTKGATRLGINYGRQRGGLLCVGGVCRIVSPSTGLSVNLSMSF